MRRLGKGYAGLKRFMVLMNLPPPMTKAAYGKIATKIHIAVKKVAENSMTMAANEVIQLSSNPLSDEGYTDIAVSNDGAWQKRGFTSLNGNVR